MHSSRKYILLPHRPLAWEAASLNSTRVDAWASEVSQCRLLLAGECTRRKVPVPQVQAIPLPSFYRLRPCVTAFSSGKRLIVTVS
jgi:hypothetical protein